MILLCLAAAVAAPLVVALREDAGAFSGAVPRVTVTDAAGAVAPVDMQDGGVAPDAVARDKTWTGAVTSLGSGPYGLTITDGGDQRAWKGSYSASGNPASIQLALVEGGAVVELASGDLPFTSAAPAAEPTTPPPPPASGDPAAAAPGPGDGWPGGAEAQPGPEGEPGGAGGEPKAAAPGDPGVAEGGDPAARPSAAVDAAAEPAFTTAANAGQTAAWMVVVLLAGWVLAGARRFTAAAVEPLPGRLPELGGKGVVLRDADWRAAVRAFAGPYRILLVGGADPGPVPAGTVFSLGPGAVSIDEVVAMLRHLDGTGPPVVLIVVGEVLGRTGAHGTAALDELGRALPKGGTAFVYPAR
ncbi:MAG: hypothetical protein EXR71_00175 [Myxococcales bacterium]|nr:hypothetical protein [Myxococcales bacterium]